MLGTTSSVVELKNEREIKTGECRELSEVKYEKCIEREKERERESKILKLGTMCY